MGSQGKHRNNGFHEGQKKAPFIETWQPFGPLLKVKLLVGYM